MTQDISETLINELFMRNNLIADKVFEMFTQDISNEGFEELDQMLGIYGLNIAKQKEYAIQYYRGTNDNMFAQVMQNVAKQELFRANAISDKNNRQTQTQQQNNQKVSPKGNDRKETHEPEEELVEEIVETHGHKR